MTQREIAALRQCGSHPNIVTLHEVYTDQVCAAQKHSHIIECPAFVLSFLNSFSVFSIPVPHISGDGAVARR